MDPDNILAIQAAMQKATNTFKTVLTSPDVQDSTAAKKLALDVLAVWSAAAHSITDALMVEIDRLED